jgi:hypothetical protein
MLKHLKISVLALLVVGFFASCANDSSVREEAANSVDGTEANAAVTPNMSEGEAALNNQKAEEPAAPTGPTTSVEFMETEFDFGKVDQGEAVQHTYKFKNTGSEPLIISSAKGSCGCTVPSWPKEPIPPGEEGEILVQFDSKGKRNKQNKKVTITANTDPPQSFIYLKGEVIAPEGEATTAQPNIQVKQ